MENSQETESSDALIGIGKHLKLIAEQQTIIAEQQKRQTNYLKDLSTALTFLTIAVVLILLVLYFGWRPGG